MNPKASVLPTTPQRLICSILNTNRQVDHSPGSTSVRCHIPCQIRPTACYMIRSVSETVISAHRRSRSRRGQAGVEGGEGRGLSSGHLPMMTPKAAQLFNVYFNLYYGDISIRHLILRTLIACRDPGCIFSCHLASSKFKLTHTVHRP